MAGFFKFLGAMLCLVAVTFTAFAGLAILEGDHLAARLVLAGGGACVLAAGGLIYATNR